MPPYACMHSSLWARMPCVLTPLRDLRVGRRASHPPHGQPSNDQGQLRQQRLSSCVSAFLTHDLSGSWAETMSDRVIVCSWRCAEGGRSTVHQACRVIGMFLRALAEGQRIPSILGTPRDDPGFVGASGNTSRTVAKSPMSVKYFHPQDSPSGAPPPPARCFRLSR